MTHAPSIREKRRPHQGLALVMATTITGFKDQYTYSTLATDGTDLPLDGAAWADWDQRGRLVFARDGRLFALAAEDIGRSEPRELIDLNDHKPEPVEAPEWAESW